MGFAKSKVNVIKEKLKVLKTVESKRLDYEYIECSEYKKNNIPPSLSEKMEKRTEDTMQQRKEKLAAYMRSYYPRYYAANKEKIAEHHRRYYEGHKEQILEQQKRYRKENKDKIAEKKCRYRETHRELFAEASRRYRARQKQKKLEAQACAND